MAAKVKMGRPPKYPWRTMKVGQWFLLTGSHSKKSAWSQMSKAKKRTRKKFTITVFWHDGTCTVRRVR